MYAQSIQDDLAALFPDIQFWHTYRPVDLAGDVLNLIIPNQYVNEQGYSIYADQDCKVKLNFCTVVLRVALCNHEQYSTHVCSISSIIQLSPTYCRLGIFVIIFSSLPTMIKIKIVKKITL